MIDWTQVIVAVVVAAPPTIIGIINKRQIAEVHTVVNSQSDRLAAKNQLVLDDRDHTIALQQTIIDQGDSHA